MMTTCFPQVVVWSALFKYHLELGHYESAYKAMMANPDAVRSASYDESCNVRMYTYVMIIWEGHLWIMLLLHTCTGGSGRP